MSCNTFQQRLRPTIDCVSSWTDTAHVWLHSADHANCIIEKMSKSLIRRSLSLYCHYGILTGYGRVGWILYIQEKPTRSLPAYSECIFRPTYVPRTVPEGCSGQCSSQGSYKYLYSPPIFGRGYSFARSSYMQSKSASSPSRQTTSSQARTK